MTHVLRPHKFECPRCTTRAASVNASEKPMHQCRGLNGLSVPLVPEGTRCKIETREREDYIGNEVVQLDAEGRPVMSAVTTRDEGQDVTVYAPTATASWRAGD